MVIFLLSLLLVCLTPICIFQVVIKEVSHWVGIVCLLLCVYFIATGLQVLAATDLIQVALSMSTFEWVKLVFALALFSPIIYIVLVLVKEIILHIVHPKTDAEIEHAVRMSYFKPK